MVDQEIYEKFIDWLGKTWWGLPDSEQLLPLIHASYTAEEAKFLTGFPFTGRSLEELADLNAPTSNQLRCIINTIRFPFWIHPGVWAAACACTNVRRIPWHWNVRKKSKIRRQPCGNTGCALWQIAKLAYR